MVRARSRRDDSDCEEVRKVIELLKISKKLEMMKVMEVIILLLKISKKLEVMEVMEVIEVIIPRLMILK